MSVSKMLKGQELFESFSFEEIDKINSFSEIKEFRKGENVYISGKTGSTSTCPTRATRPASSSVAWRKATCSAYHRYSERDAIRRRPSA
jgi:hypothetical protein